MVFIYCPDQCGCFVSLMPCGLIALMMSNFERLPPERKLGSCNWLRCSCDQSSESHLKFLSFASNQSQINFGVSSRQEHLLEVFPKSSSSPSTQGLEASFHAVRRCQNLELRSESWVIFPWIWRRLIFRKKVVANIHWYGHKKWLTFSFMLDFSISSADMDKESRKKR